MNWKKIISLTIFLTILAITFILPNLSFHLNLIAYYSFRIIVILLTIFLFWFDFSVFVPTLFFTICFLTRPIPFDFLEEYNLNFPGLIFLFPSLIYFVFIFIFKRIGQEITWLCWGRMDIISWFLIVILVVGSAVGLFLWVSITNKDLSQFTYYLPDYSSYFLFLGGLGFAISNSIMEEFLSRGLMWEGFEKIFNSFYPVLLFQALVFSIWHWNGLPGGWTGIIMVFIWSLFLGYLRYRSKGMLAPIIAHFFADFTIFLLLLSFV